MTARLFILILIFALANLGLLGQVKHNPRLRLGEWNSGEIVLSTGEVISGEINHQYIAKTITIYSDEKALSFSFHQVASLKYFKTETQPERNFRSLQFDGLVGVFEVISENTEYAFLSINQVVEEAQTIPTINLFTLSVNGTMTVLSEYQGETFFLVTNSGVLYNLGYFTVKGVNKKRFASRLQKKKVIEILNQFKEGVSEHIWEYALNIDKRNDFFNLLEWMTSPEE